MPDWSSGRRLGKEQNADGGVEPMHLVSLVKLTSEGRLHGSLHHPDEQLETLGVLGQTGGKRRQGVGMATQVLQGNPLTEVGLDGEKMREGGM